MREGVEWTRSFGLYSFWFIPRDWREEKSLKRKRMSQYRMYKLKKRRRGFLAWKILLCVERIYAPMNPPDDSQNSWDAKNLRDRRRSISKPLLHLFIDLLIMMVKKKMTFLLSSSSSLTHLLDCQTFIIILCLAGILPLHFNVNCLGDASGNASLVSRSHGLLLEASHRYEQIPDLDQMSSSTDSKYPSASSSSSSTNKETAKDSSSKTTTESSGLLGRLLSVIRSAPEDKEFIPILKNCTLPLISEVSSGNLFRNLDWNYFAFRVNRQGSERFDVLRRSFSHVVSYGAFKRLLFPSRTERNHVYFDCAFDKFFNAMMNRTPYVWIQWVSFDGIKFPFVLWQKVNMWVSFQTFIT